MATIHALPGSQCVPKRELGNEEKGSWNKNSVTNFSLGFLSSAGFQGNWCSEFRFGRILGRSS
jgi:hypothetical protein